jgi:hypothetical protein
VMMMSCCIHNYDRLNSMGHAGGSDVPVVSMLDGCAIELRLGTAGVFKELEPGPTY